MSILNQFITLHKPQLESSGVPEQFWPALHQKLSTETFDVGEALQLMLIDYEEEVNNAEAEESRPVFTAVVCCESGVKASDPQAIYLIDHAWTFRISFARQQLEKCEQLADRICAITGVDIGDERRIDKILKRIWQHCQAYSISTDGLTAEERLPIWYVMDEVGSAINHSDQPNFRLVPFLHLQTQITYSLLFPIKDVDVGQQVTRDFVEYVDADAPERCVLLLPWRNVDMRNEGFLQTDPGEQYYLSGHLPETYTKGEIQAPQLNRNEPLKVFAEYTVVQEFLTAPCFELVDSVAEADVLWLTHHFKDFAALSKNTPNKFINQFPFEYVLTIKDLLSITSRRAAIEHHNNATLETYPSWLPTTFNLKTELVQFASYFQHRKLHNLDNHWIIKPWNLARGLDTHITNSLSRIVRLPATGPKIAQKYIERPVLFYRDELDANVKFDVRYVVLLKDVQPLEAYIHRKFFLRFANKPFSLDNLDDYEKHFTVMNYEQSATLCHIKCDDFLQYWQDQYPNHPWLAIENQICAMLYELLTCATKEAPPRGIPASPQSRALYAADIMLEWTTNGQCIQPKLLEVNWTPDCKRACDYYPDFFNDIFKLLFLNVGNEDSFRLLNS